MPSLITPVYAGNFPPKKGRSMILRHQFSSLLGMGTLFVASAFAQQADMKTITGCLDKSGGQYVLTQESTGQKVIVRGSEDLEKHAANHKVTLKGNTVTVAGQSVFEVSSIQHVSNSCDTASKPRK
jgi:hypothetical protein